MASEDPRSSLKVCVATCSLNQWALDFDGNYSRICKTITQAKDLGALIRVGTELEICGYGCYDHFYEPDTLQHCWQSLARLLSNTDLLGILVFTGMPVMHRGVLYNCTIAFLNQKIVFIKPKMHLANELNYREMRYFVNWKRARHVESFVLPKRISLITKQSEVPFGDGIITTTDNIEIGCETCEELFVPHSPHIDMSLDGVSIFVNLSASHHILRKLNYRIELIMHSMQKVGGVYMYSNQKGCDGDRTYYDGCPIIVVNGKLAAQGTQFGLQDTEVITAVIDIEEVYNYRSAVISRSHQASTVTPYPRTKIDIVLGGRCTRGPTTYIQPRYHTPEQEICYGPASWLWDYLRRSKMAGFFLPLSGGVDSASVALIVSSMCHMIVATVPEADSQVLRDIRSLTGLPDYTPTDPSELCERLLVTAYMGTENSSVETQDRAGALAKDVGSYHVDINIDGIVKAILTVFSMFTNMTPKFKVYGGTPTENIALQNIQARVRMVTGYLFAQLINWSRGKPGSLLVLSSANVDESLVGYLTKYDCSSGDLNPVGSICKRDLKSFVGHCKEVFGFASIESFLSAVPTAELEPITEDHVQTDEDDIGLTYDELNDIGKLRKIERCGPFYMYKRLSFMWEMSPVELAGKVKTFFHKYAINRHKACVITPAFLCEQYCPDDNRFDLRPFLYNPKWDLQFREIDSSVASRVETDMLAK